MANSDVNGRVWESQEHDSNLGTGDAFQPMQAVNLHQCEWNDTGGNRVLPSDSGEALIGTDQGLIPALLQFPFSSIELQGRHQL
jgi:hypothetical protein